MLTKRFQITVGVLGGALILGLGAYGASLKNENNYLRLHPMTIKIVETATPTSTPSATPTFYFKKVTPTIPLKK